MKFAVVTNSYRRSRELVEKSLSAALSQNPKPELVVLIDQNKPPIELSDHLKHNPRFKHMNVSVTSVSAARNRLQVPTDIEWLIFCDDDGYLDSDYMTKLVQIAREHPNLEVIAGSIRRIDTGGFYSLRHKAGGSLKNFRHTKLLMGSNFCVKRETFDNLGRFDETFGAGAFWGSGEETDFCWKAFFKQTSMEFFPELVVHHIPPFNESVTQGFKKSFHYGVGKGALVAKWLFQKGQLLTLFELLEMIVIPPIQMARGIVTLRWGLAFNNVGSLAGRLWGLLKYNFVTRNDEASSSTN